MKTFAVIFLFILITRSNKATNIEVFRTDGLNDLVSRAAGDRLKQVIESFKEILKHGNESLGIPVGDPYKSDPLNLLFESETMKGNLNIENTEVFGISSYIVNKADFKMVGLKMSMDFQWCKIKGDINGYSLDGVFLNLINIYGKGDAEFTLKNLNVSIDLAFNINTTTKTLFIKSMETKFSFESLKFYSEGFYNDKDISQVFSAIISDMAPKFIETHQKKLTEIINENAMDIVNDFLSKKTLNNLLAFIS